ncbi:MAG: kynureninase [Flavobacteriales bacterium]|nr:kynureninase [Flavobacteriales bacterium]
MNYENSLNFAQSLDATDELAPYRERFYIPEVNGEDSVYFCGNSLGLQPKSAKLIIEQELNDWANLGVRGHFEAENPWYSYHEKFAEPLSKIVGALPSEVVAMNGLTVNLHLLFVSFYRPTSQRYKIICEAKAFPSDQYAIESQIKLHGLNLDEVLVEVGPREGESCIHHEDIISAIEEHKEHLALVFIGGVNYYSGQRFDMAAITEVGQKAGALVGFDLAHAVGNVELDLHDWNVDFAAWCSYKYLNSGSGGVAGAYVHERHFGEEVLRFAGWWGYNKETRFKMEQGFRPIPSAEGWQLSNAPVLSMAVHKASLDIFSEIGMQKLFEKRNKLTGFLEFLIVANAPEVKVITPADPNERGCQLSMLLESGGKERYEALGKAGVVADWREPNVIRVAPVPLYNTFEDVYKFGEIIGSNN